MGSRSDTKWPHAVLLASPGMGHVIPFLELGHRLVSRHGFKAVTVFVASLGSSASDINLVTPCADVDLVTLPAADVSGLVTPSTSILVRCALAIRLSLPALRSAISALKVPPVVLVVDQFATEAHVVAAEFEMTKYVFFPCSAWFLALTLHVPHLDRDLENQHVKDQKPLSIPGCEPVGFEYTFEPILCRESDYERFSEYVRMGVEISNADGILVNTWHDLEPKTLRALSDEKMLGRRAKVFPIGPVLRPVNSSSSRVVEWLDMQANESVIYVSFGSGGTMSAEQINEIAWGLESSQHRFIWVARPPAEGNTAATYFNAAGKRIDDEGPDYLPDGFLGRTKELGMVIPKWAPQSEILAHPSVGGFLSHCGWNSTLESLVNGVPMIAWPLYAEQKLNTALLVEESGVGMRPEELPTKKVVRREEIEKMVREVMERESAMRSKAKELKQTANTAMEIGGSSYESICEAFNKCQTHRH